MLSARNDADQGLADFENGSNVGVRYADRAHAADQKHIVVAQFGLKRRGAKASQPLSMSRVVPMGAPFEIRNDVIGSDRVNVVDDREALWIGNEGKSHQSVNAECRVLSVFSENDSWVARALMHLHSHRSSDAPLAMPIGMDDFARNTSDVPVRTNFVAPLVSEDGSPFFNDADIHEAGRPSGVFGLAVKNPSRAATYDGFAIMAAHSDTYNGRLDCLSH